MISLKKIIENSNHCIESYKFIEEMFLYRQISDTIFEKTKYKVYKGDIYDGQLMYKKNNQVYLYLGFDEKLGLEIYIPIFSEKGDIIIERNEKKLDKN